MSNMTIKVEASELASAIVKLANALLDEKTLAAIFAEHIKTNGSDTSALAPAATPPRMTTPGAGMAPAPINPPAAAPQSGAPAPVTAPVAPVTAPVPVAAPTPPVAVAAPAVSTTTPAPAPAAPAVPVTAALAYTLDQIAKAGASLVDAGKMEPLLALLTKYGVQAVTQLAPEQYGVFATELRALGAQI